MPYYTYKNSKIQLNGSSVLVRGASIDYNAEISASYDVSDRNTTQFRPNDGIKGTLNFNYLITGDDFVKDFIYDEQGNISGSFGGLFFESGFLTSYRFSATPASPVSVDASVVFFDDLKGSFSPTFEEASSNKILNFSDAQISNTVSSGVGNLGSIQKATYNYASEISPVYVVGEKTPREIRYGRKGITAQVEIDNLSGDLSIFGNDAALQLSLKDPTTEAIRESYTVNGRLEKKSIQVQANSPLSTSISVKQNRVSREPEITSFTPTTFFEESQITINGTNLMGTRTVTFGGVQGTLISSSSTQLTVKVPKGASSTYPYITILGSDGNFTFGTPYDLVFRNMSVSLEDSFTTGKIGDDIEIGGSNFSRISDVKFAGVSSPSFEVLNETKIIAEIPERADRGKVSVVSDVKSQTINSSKTFFPQPHITGAAPKIVTQAGQTVVLKGSAFSDVNSVTVNSISIPFSISDGYNIVLTVPDQDVEGKIKATNTKSLFGESEFVLEQPPIITGFENGQTAGLNPRVNETIFISGSNFYPNKFDDDNGSDSVTVLFAGRPNNELPRVQAVFGVVSTSGITGVIPNNARDGKVFLFKSDQTNVYPSGLGLDLIEAPGTITSVGDGSLPIVF